MAVAMVVVVKLLLLHFLGLFAALFDDFDVVVEDGSNDRDHVSLHNACAHVFRATNADVDDTLEREIPLPHAHHILAPTLFENADKAFDASIDSEDVANTS
jgi:hypothetical protein